MKRHLYILFFYLIAIGCGFAQTLFPVQASISLIPPYSVYLSDYLDPAAGKLNVSLVVTDPSQEDLQIKLKFTISSGNIMIQTKPDYLPSPIQINGGSIETFDAGDLADYFRYDHLDFYGIDKTEFQRTSRLPEGIYRFSVEVVEYRRGVVVSNNAFTLAWLILNDPPRWSIPSNNQIVMASNPQNFQFVWYAMHAGSPNAAFTTEYEFKLVEIWPDNRNPNDAINSQVPFYVMSTSGTSMIMGPSESLMIPGRKYAARIRAVAEGQERDLFKNNGFSEVLVFTYGSQCEIPVVQTEPSLNFTSAQLLWNNISGAESYSMYYHERGQSESTWYASQSTFNQLTLSNLTSGKEYDYYIIANCSNGIVSEKSSLSSFILPVKKDGAFICKEVLNAWNSTVDQAQTIINQANAISQQYSELTVDKVIKALGYDLKIEQLTKMATGGYDGSGTICVGFLNNATFNVRFSGLRVKADNTFDTGTISITSKSLNAAGKVKLDY